MNVDEWQKPLVGLLQLVNPVTASVKAMTVVQYTICTCSY